MAHGGSTALPRAHRPRPAVMSGPAPATAPLQPLRPPPALGIGIGTGIGTTTTPTPVGSATATPTATATSTFSLTAPRPENQRSANEYVETPFRGGAASSPGGGGGSGPPSPQPPQLQPAPRAERPSRLPLPPPPLPLPLPPPVTKQPAVASFSKEPGGAGGGVAGAGAVACPAARPSIMCPECGRCRCASCQQPRPLPQRWICNNSCLLSAETVIDYASCLCCVKALFYHCSESDGGGAESCADSPCSCGPDRCAARWSCLGALSCVLPCLWLYWPLRSCKRAVEVCYTRHSRSGCRCRPPLDTPKKRLLEPSPDL